jgi:hypothetical protein
MEALARRGRKEDGRATAVGPDGPDDGMHTKQVLSEGLPSSFNINSFNPGPPPQT